MAWRTGGMLLRQNTVTTFTIGPHGSLSSRDVIVAEPVAGGNVSIERVVTLTNPIRYQVSIRASGNGLVQIWGERIA